MKAPKLSHLWDRHPDDWYVEPSWCSERLFAVHSFEGAIHDPAAGLCRIVDSARAAGYYAVGTDIECRDPKRPIVRQDWLEPSIAVADNVVSNPPFKHCNDDAPFVMKSLIRARRQVALLLPAAWVQGDKRSRWLEQTPLRTVYFLTPRPSMPPGPVIKAGVEPGNGTKDFAWFVWDHSWVGSWQGKWLRRDD